MIHLHWEECDALLGLLRALRYDDRSDELELVDQARGVVERLRAGVLPRLSREECQALLELMRELGGPTAGKWIGELATAEQAKVVKKLRDGASGRTRAGRQGHQPVTGVNADHSLANLSCYRWQKHCRGLYQTPMAA